MSEIAVHAPRHARDKSIELLQGSEVKFNLHAGSVEQMLPVRHELPHVSAGFREEHALVFRIELSGKRCSGVGGISHKDAREPTVQPHEDRGIMYIACGETHRKDFPFEISREVQFEPIKPAVSCLPPVSEQTHGFVVPRVLYTADGDIRRVRVLHEVGLAAVHPKNEREDESHPVRPSVQGHDERLVRTSRLQELVRRLLRLNVLLLLQESCSNGVLRIQF